MHTRIGLCLLALALLISPASAQNCATFPNPLANGTVADATKVMGNFTYLGGCAASIASPAFTGTASIGGTATASPLTVYASSTSTSGTFYGIDLLGSQSVATTGSYTGIYSAPAYTASGTLSSNFWGIGAAPANTGGGTVTYMFGVNSAPLNSGGGTVNYLYGVGSYPANSGGSITTLAGVQSNPTELSAATGTVTSMYALMGNCLNQSTSGAVVTNCYELYLGNPTVTGAISNIYGVYQTYSSAVNYMAGKVEIGNSSSSPSYLLQVGSGSASGVVQQLQNSSGACTHTPGSSSETVSCSSDERLKRDIVDAKPALPELADMRVRDFTVRATGERKTGVIAQELLKAHPDMVHLGPDGFYKVDEPNPWKLVKAIQELKASNDSQAQEIAQLRGEISRLQNDRQAKSASEQELSTLKAANALLKARLDGIDARLDGLETRHHIHSASRSGRLLHLASSRGG